MPNASVAGGLSVAEIKVSVALMELALPTDGMIDAAQGAIAARLPEFARLAGPEQYRIAHMSLLAGMSMLSSTARREISEQDRVIATLEQIIRKVSLHEWIIFTAYSASGQWDASMGFQVNVRDEPSRSALSQTYSPLPGSFGRTPIEAGMRAVGLETSSRAAEVPST